MCVLGLRVEYHHSAVAVDCAELYALVPEQLRKQGAAYCPKVAGDDIVVVRRDGAGCGKIAVYGLCCRRRHCCAHIGDVGYAHVRCLAYTAAGYLAEAFCPGKYHRSGGSAGPLGCGRALAAVGQGIAELSLCCGEVGGGHRCGALRCSGFYKHGCGNEPFRHCGAGSVKPHEGYLKVLQAVCRAGTLVYKVSGKNDVDGLLCYAGPGGGYPHCLKLEPGFSLLPGGLAEMTVLYDAVETAPEGAFAFLFACC